MYGSGIEYCWIDLECGLDVVEVVVEIGLDDVVVFVELSFELLFGFDIDIILLDVEVLCENVKKVIKVMFSEVWLGKVLDMECCVMVVEEIVGVVL